MAAVTDKTIEVVEKFLRQLKNADINIERAVLFGSYVRGAGRGRCYLAFQSILFSPNDLLSGFR